MSNPSRTIRSDKTAFSPSHCFICGQAEAYAELIARGVRPLAQMTLIFEPPTKASAGLAAIRKVARSYGVAIVRQNIARDARMLALNLVFYPAAKPALRKRAEHLLDLFGELLRLHRQPAPLALHRKIGQMLGYSNAAIAEHAASLTKTSRIRTS